MRISRFRKLPRAVAALCEHRQDERKFDSRAVMSPFSANGAVFSHSLGQRSKKTFRKATAFSLVEVVLALGVAAFCLIAVLGLMPAGVHTNRNATSQTAATNIVAAIVADLRTTPAASTTSPQFGITFGTDKTLYFDASGQPSASLGPDSRYQLNVVWHSAPAGLYYADLKVTWPASVDPIRATPSGLVKLFAAFDRS